MGQKITLTPAPLAASGQRIDQFLTQALSDMGEVGMSRSRVQELIGAGAVFQIDNMGQESPIHKKTRKIQPGEVFTVLVPPPTPMDIAPENIPLNILYEDDSLIVVNKPAHIATHPAAGSRTGTLVHALLYYCQGRLSGIGGVERPGIVHRLDKGTSGVMVVAKSDEAHQGLARQFKDRTINRRYMAICAGVPQLDKGNIKGNIGRHPKDRKKMTVLAKDGKPATTSYWVTGLSEYNYAKLDLKLHTGRTHQIRVHMAHVGHPLLGDPVYGKKQVQNHQLPQSTKQAIEALKHQMLHAYKLEFDHPVSGKKLSFEHHCPENMQTILSLLQINSIG